MSEIPTISTAAAPVWFLTPSQLERLQHRLDTIRTRALKRGFTGDLTLTTTPATRTEIIGGTRITHPGYEVTLTGTAPSYEGWTFLGAIDTVGDEVVVRLAPGIPDDAVRHDQIQPGICEHCHSRRARKHLLLVRNDTTGELRQVGSTCLKDFLGWSVSPVLLWERSVADDLDQLCHDGWQDAWTMRDILAVAMAAADTYGWVSKAMTQDNPNLIPTATVVRKILTHESGSAAFREDVMPAIPQAAERVEEVRRVLLEACHGEGSGYMANLGALLRSDQVELRHLALAVSAVAAYDRAITSQAEREERERAAAERREAAQASQWLGAVGDKITVAGTITAKRYIEGSWNRASSWLITLDTEQGVAKTFTAAKWADDVTAGEHLELAGTIKELEIFQDTRQTLLTRCRPLPAAQAAA